MFSYSWVNRLPNNQATTGTDQHEELSGNPTKSCRSKSPLRVTGEVTDWQGNSPEQLNAMKEHLERLKKLGIEAIED
ncbi:NAD(+)--rifampin ADP-ribosyltransferase [Hymenobacter antarcticus]